MPRSASRCAIASRNACRIPAPAPWASTWSRRATSGRSSSADTLPTPSPTANVSSFWLELVTLSSTEAVMELLERLHEIGLQLEHRAQRVFPQLLHSGRGRLDRELLDVELRRHL